MDPVQGDTLQLLALCQPVPRGYCKFRFRNKLLNFDASAGDLCPPFELVIFQRMEGAAKQQPLPKQSG